MGARGPVGRPGEHRHGHREAPVVELVQSRPDVTVPKPPPGMLAATRRAWARYWQSDVATVATEADRDLVERLFVFRDEHARALRTLRATGERMVSGSRSQPRLSPLLDLVFKLEGAIHTLETELGLSPLARARLGIAVGQATLTAAELNRMTRDRPHHDDEDDDEYEDA
jgi:P27 family predicted phage terminase small subunit